MRRELACSVVGGLLLLLGGCASAPVLEAPPALSLQAVPAAPEEAARVAAVPSSLAPVPLLPSSRSSLSAPPPRKPALARRRFPEQPERYASHAGWAERALPYADYLTLRSHLEGVASWYGTMFHGRKTANGEIYNQYALTAAHLRLPMGTLVLVENTETRTIVRVRINDRGPYKKQRILDLSRAAAARLGMIRKGTAPVRITVLKWPAGMDPRGGLKVYSQYVVQVAAFPDLGKAMGQQRTLQQRFRQLRFQLKRTVGGLYRIWVGPFDKQGRARQVAALLRRDGVHSLVRSHRK